MRKKLLTGVYRLQAKVRAQIKLRPADEVGDHECYNISQWCDQKREISNKFSKNIFKNYINIVKNIAITSASLMRIIKSLVTMVTSTVQPGHWTVSKHTTVVG